MKYLCLIYDEEKKMAGMSKSEGDAFMGEYGAFTASVKSSGHYLGGEALQPVQTATTIRSRNGKVSTTDGPVPAPVAAATTSLQPALRNHGCQGNARRHGEDPEDRTGVSDSRPGSFRSRRPRPSRLPKGIPRM